MHCCFQLILFFLFLKLVIIPWLNAMSEAAKHMDEIETFDICNLEIDTVMWKKLTSPINNNIRERRRWILGTDEVVCGNMILFQFLYNLVTNSVIANLWDQRDTNSQPRCSSQRICTISSTLRLHCIFNSPSWLIYCEPDSGLMCRGVGTCSFTAPATASHEVSSLQLVHHTK